MAEAGYSGTPLQKKLGYKEGWALLLLGGSAPGDFAGHLTGVSVKKSGKADAAHLFATTQAELLKLWDKAVAAVPENGMVWVSWPKKASGVPTDITENVLRDLLLPTGWVDTKVAAVDETWSGLKFVKRVSERTGAG